MFESFFKNVRDAIDAVEKTIDNTLATVRTKPFLYSVAASYKADGIRKLTSACIIARNEQFAINLLKVRIANNNGTKRIEYINTIANPVSAETLLKIKRDC